MGPADESVSASGRLCSPCAPFRGESCPRLDAGRATRQLDRRLGAPGSRVRYLLVPRQYRRSADRRDRCAACLQRPRRIGYLAAIVAASNAGGSGSVIGDTTTTMLWIAGVSPLQVLHAYVAARVRCSSPAFRHRLPTEIRADVKDPPTGLHISFRHVVAVIVVLASAIAANVGAHLLDAHLLDKLPLIGLAVAARNSPDGPDRATGLVDRSPAARGALFLLALVSAASMMPVQSLPVPSWETALGLGFISAVFDNIPLAALAIKQGNYDWGFLATLLASAAP